MIIVEFESDSNEEKSGFALRWKSIQPQKKTFDCAFNRGACNGWKTNIGNVTWLENITNGKR